MKKLTKIFSVIAVIAILVVSLSVFVSCSSDKAATEDSTFELVVRAYNGVDDNYNVKMDGAILAQKTVQIRAGQVNVSEALATVATVDGSSYKISFNDTDYLLFVLTQPTPYTTSWYLSSGNFVADQEYVDADFQYSYMAFNGHYSNGVTTDFVDGLTTYTIVIDGWDGIKGA